MGKKSELSVYLLIDRSGSMASRWDETIGAVNNYIATLAADKATKKAKATVAVFDASGPINFDILRRGEDVGSWTALSVKEASPRGMTPLFDAIGRLSTLVNEDAPAKAVVAVVTDGAENCSRELTRESAKASLDALRAKGFQVVFLGADFDAFGQAASVGTQKGQTISMNSGSYAGTMRSMAAQTASYATSGATMSWSEEDRAKAAKQRSN
ncbi:VWA domain-containing protein [Mesorhizobium amorphae]|uniref:VWA domain-containing protein n=1 Tax=Mesorhizobium amorphae TaxID=71433 RepID=UPI00118640B2|nr:VWA domain-containing protein [Mesorhizobium amorphae]